MTWRASGGLTLLLVLSVAQPAWAQRRDGSAQPTRRAAPQSPAKPKPAGAAAAVRAELAAVLLQARRYDEAAREYRALIAREPGSVAYRLGLARALAWGKRPREAEHELRILSARRPNDREIDALLRSVRESFEPRSREAASWLMERPGHVPYRRALARALVREGKPRNALPHYDTLLAFDTSAALRREAVNAQVAGGDYTRAARLLRRALDRAPGDTTARHALAGVLTQAQQYDAALGQYDTLIAWYPVAALLRERAQLQVGLRNLTAAEADANASILAGPNAGAYLLLGDLRRWRGDFAEARVVYEYARMLVPNDRAIATASAQLARDERPIVAFLPAWDVGAAWQLRTASVSDNVGLSYAIVGARRNVELPHGLNGSVDLELRRLAEHAPGQAAGVAGFAWGLGLSQEFGHGAFLARLSGRGGVVVHADGSMFAGGIATTGWFGAWGLSLEHGSGPAYPSLLTAASIRPPDTRGEPLTERTTSAALGGPLGRADIAFTVQRADISDDNRRSTVQAVLRYPLTPHVTAMYSGSGIWFAERSALYWDPTGYLASLAGLEYATRRPRGLSFSSRLLAGPARTIEEVVRDRRRSEEVTHEALQFTGGGEVSYRSEAGELGAAVTYGSGRTGEYRRVELSVHARLLR